MNNKQQLIFDLMADKLNKASKESLLAMLKRPNSVRVAKIANFSVSGVKLSEIFSNEELYELTNNIYYLAEDLLSPTLNGVEDKELLAKLQA